MVSVDATQLREQILDGPDPEYESSRLEEIFGDDTRARVVTFLATNTGRPWSQKEIAREVGASQAMVSRVSQELRACDVVRRSEGPGLDGLELKPNDLTSLLKQIAREGDEMIE